MSDRPFSVSQFTSAFVPASPRTSEDDVARRPVEVAAALRQYNRRLLSELRGNVDQLRAEHARLTAARLPSSAPPVQSREQVWADYGLTEREIEVARLLAEGRRNTAIAGALGISPHTARHHTQRVLAKLGVHSRAEAGARLRG
jgi:DNA-binding NarL/FixJ family response regulator